MLKNFLWAKKGSLEQKKKKFGNKTAKLILLFIMLWAVFLIAQPIMAATIEPGLNMLATPLGLSTQDIRITIAKIIRIALGFLGILAVSLIVYGGFLYLTSYGAEDKIKKAKAVLRDAVIGLIIILLAYAIASFVINALLTATGLGGPPIDYGAGGGALGNGIIESHYPARNAIGVPRNTSIVVTFKVPMNVNSLIFPSNGKINSDNIKIHITGQTDFLTEVTANNTEDKRTYIFKPQDLLGNSEQPTNYTVELLGTIEMANGKGAFGAYGSYKWSFEVSTIVDVTPPQITTVIPKPSQTVPRNMVVQINFNEPINPLTISGTAGVNGTNQNIIISADGTPIDGKFSYGNMYQTVEFVTNDLCGKNTCGGDVFCLPGNENISILTKAATLKVTGNSEAKFPFEGIVDMADNSLDGNKDNIAQGPEAQSTFPPYDLNNPVTVNFGDDVTWNFDTNNTIDLEPPELNIGYIPEPNKQDFNPASILEVPFTKLMMKTTLTSDRGYNEGYCYCTLDSQCPGTTCDLVKNYCLNETQERFICRNTEPLEACPGGQECLEKHHITLNQPTPQENPIYIPRGYYITSEEITTGLTEVTKAYLIPDPRMHLAEFTDYGLFVGSGVKDLMQNCLQPCAGPGCVKTPTGIPGQYQQGAQWQPVTGGFPSCQITTWPLPLP